MNTIQGGIRSRRKPARRTALALLAALGLAVAASTVAAPLAVTAHAANSGASGGGGIEWGR